MKNIFLKSIVGTGLALLMLVVGTQSFVSGQISEKQERTIEGVWRTVVTPLNCQTGLPVAPSFRVCSLLTKAAQWRNMVLIPV